jgi:hypothetical protein
MPVCECEPQRLSCRVGKQPSTCLHQPHQYAHRGPSSSFFGTPAVPALADSRPHCTRSPAARSHACSPKPCASQLTSDGGDGGTGCVRRHGLGFGSCPRKQTEVAARSVLEESAGRPCPSSHSLWGGDALLLSTGAAGNRTLTLAFGVLLPLQIQDCSRHPVASVRFRRCSDGPHAPPAGRSASGAACVGSRLPAAPLPAPRPAADGV